MKVAFLDRDGTVIIDYPDNEWSKIKFPEFLEGSIDALQYIKSQGFEIIIITNQYLIGEGVITLDEYKKFSNSFLKILKQNNVDVLDVFYCPHARNENCNCIKPNLGFINRALSKYPDIDLNESFYVGDSLSDKELAESFNLTFYGINLPCKNKISSLIDVKSFL